MYYATELFVRKGVLGKIWLAGSVFHKLSKKAIIESDISELCVQVRDPPIPLAISTCGKLILGIVRIHERCGHYIFISANEAQLKLRRALVSENKVNLPTERLLARDDQITLAERREPSLGDLGDIDIELAEFHQLQISNDLVASEHAITLPEEELLRERARGLDFESLDLDFDLEMEEREILFSDEEKEADVKLEPETPELVKQLQLLEPEVEVPEIEPPVGEVEVPSVHLSLPVSIPSVRTVPELEISALAELEEKLEPVVEQEEVPSVEVMSSTLTPESVHYARLKRRAKRKKRVKKRRFRSVSDEIELPRHERLISSHNIDQYTVDRPHFALVNEQRLGVGEFEQLFCTSLTGVYGQGRAAEIFAQFTSYIFDLRSMREWIEEEEKQIVLEGASVELPRGVSPTAVPDRVESAPGIELPPIEEKLQLVEQPVIEVPSEEISLVEVPSRGSDVSSREFFLGRSLLKYGLEELEPILKLREESSISTIPEIDRDKEVTVESLQEEMEMEMEKEISEKSYHSSDQRRALLHALPTTSSDELTVPTELTKLSFIFKQMVEKEMDRVVEKRVRQMEEDIEVSVDMEQLLERNSTANNSVLTARDVALGFMQALILNNEDIIRIEQDSSYDPIYILKGLNFERVYAAV